MRKGYIDKHKKGSNMEKVIEVKTREELIALINELEGDFIIHIEEEEG